MPETPDDARREQSETVDASDPAAGDRPEIACTLTAEQTDERREWMAENLLPYLESVEERGDGFSFVFDRNPEAYAAVTDLARKESQCCAWATFQVELPPDDVVRWNVQSERRAGFEFFEEALRETLREFEDAPSIE